jgi:hypothetical protein
LATPQVRIRPTAYKDKYLGILVLVAAQILVGFIHIAFGVWMLVAPYTEPVSGLLDTSAGPDIYAIYTVAFSVLTLVFAWAVWMKKSWSWIGTVAVALFVIVADSLTLLDLPSIPGIPKFAGFGEITYSVIVILYLTQSHVRATYGINRTSQNSGEDPV